MRKLLLATRNQKKLLELRRLLQGLPLEVLGLEAFPTAPQVKETGQSFAENATLKATQVARHTGLWAVADDSGLEVDALDGAPGIYSARYAGPEATDQDNIQKLLRELEDVPPPRRTARFRAVLALANPKGQLVALFEGTVEGLITTSPKGQGGFGYDPVFQPLGHDRTFAQMSPQEKDALSHRARALKRLRTYLVRNLL
mgnify:CR=1 FL=1